ncbi:unnamed protein product [Chrysoparadoxa australica]
MWKGGFSLLLLLGDSLAFRPPTSLLSQQQVAGSCLRMSLWERHDDDQGQNSKNIKNLLMNTACASVSYYMTEFGDDVTPKWLHEFSEERDLSVVGWASFLQDLLRAEPEEMVIKRILQRPRGGSGNNPFLADNRTQMEYTQLIEPAVIAKKIITVREQIADEWMHDLGLVALENSEMSRHHMATLNMDENEAARSRQLVFDHDPFGETTTPYRAKNYARLLELATTIGIQRYTSELRIRGDRYSQNWLEKFLHKNEGLTGNELLDAMLKGTLIMIKDPKRVKPRVVEPTKIAGGVMKYRGEAASELIEVLESIPSDHSLVIRKVLEANLKAQMDPETLVMRRQ